MGISDIQHMYDMAAAEEQGSKDAAAAVAKAWPTGPERIKAERAKAMDAHRKAVALSHKTADGLMSSIREMVHAEVTGDGEQYSRHETVVREELNELYRRIGALEHFARQITQRFGR